MSLEILIALAAFALITSITPGPNNLMVMASGANFGVRRTLPHMAGVLFGFNFMVWIVGAGLISVLEAVPASFIVLKALSAAFLLFLAWKIANAAAPGDDPKAVGGKPLSFFQAAAFQWVNPKAWALSISAVGAYVNEAHPVLSLAAVGVVFLAAGAPSMSTWMLLGTQLRRFLTNAARLRFFNWTCAALLVATLWPILSAV